MTPTFHTLTRFLTPWRTIRRLEAENLELRRRANTLADLRFSLVDDVRYLENQLATAREALQRVATGGWYKNSIYSVDYEDCVVEGVRRWVRDGMTGPLPPLPEYLARREKADAGETP